MIEHGILLAGGSGTRLAPLTQITNKHLIPLYNRFIIDYPIDTLRNLGIKNLTVILGGNHFSQVVSYLKDGKQFGLNINYVYQNEPLGIAHAINLCRPFIPRDKRFITILGDNIFDSKLEFYNESGAQVILHKHSDLNRFGVASIKEDFIVNIIEKPKYLDSQYEHYAITGCYKFDERFFKYFSRLTPSARGEYEIVDILLRYHIDNALGWRITEGLWSDAGTHESINFLNNYFYKKGHK